MKVVKNLFLASVIFTSLVSPIKVSSIYEQGKHKDIFFSDRTYYVKSYGGIKKSKERYSTIRKCLELMPNFEIEEVKYPDDITGIEKDIPFNYFSNIELSSKLLYSVLYNDWELLKYQAEPDCIKVELEKDDVTCRMVIFKDHLKVYQKAEL